MLGPSTALIFPKALHSVEQSDGDYVTGPVQTSSEETKTLIPVPSAC